ncbi:hypothetical protein D3C71_1472910 [compost metagenome]
MRLARAFKWNVTQSEQSGLEWRFPNLTRIHGYQNYTKMIAAHLKREARCATLIRNRQFQLHRFIQHYKQDLTNPIPDWEKRAYDRVIRRQGGIPGEAD